MSATRRIVRDLYVCSTCRDTGRVSLVWDATCYVAVPPRTGEHQEPCRDCDLGDVARASRLHPVPDVRDTERPPAAYAEGIDLSRRLLSITPLSATEPDALACELAAECGWG